MKRLLDIFLSLTLSILVLPLAIAISFGICLTFTGSILYWSDRVGRHGRIFSMPKFRTMLENTPELATHLLKNPHTHLILFGGFLRRSSLDELPQLWSILKGDMSFVGPRPVLHNQKDLISLRAEQGIDNLLPGLTGWAQVNGRDEITDAEKLKLDKEYLKRSSILFDLYIIWLTVIKVISRDGISH